MYSIRMNLKRASGKRSSVRLIVRLNGRKVVYATGVSVEVSDWDRKRERVKGGDADNRKLEEARRKVREHIEQTGTLPSRSDWRREEYSTVLGLIEDKRLQVLANGGAEQSWRNYQTLAALILRFCEGKTALVSEVSGRWLSRFVEWMNKQDYANGHTAKMVRLLKAAIGQKVAANVWKDVKPPKNTPAEMVYLTPEEIALLEKMEFRPGDKLERVRDLFLIGCYTALRHSDWRKVSMDRVRVIGGVKVLVIVQQKTGGSAALPIGERLERLMSKYSVQGWPALSEQKLNKSVKELCRKAGIVQTVAVTGYRGGKAVVTTGPKWQFVSSHTARRSFATNAVLAGIPVSEVMKFTGHKSLSAFFQYIRTTGQEAAVLYASHPFFTGK